MILIVENGVEYLIRLEDLFAFEEGVFNSSICTLMATPRTELVN